MTREDEHFMSRVEGLHVGLLTDDERAELRDLERRGVARVTYEGAAGLMGVGRVRRAEDVACVD